ncbi:MAG TPA: ribosome biogenesis factor YjgA [Desulfomonilia bacterium]|nr:ribosome biogenesis factor YjgA [Desulfomonilia bacterium]
MKYDDEIFEEQIPPEQLERKSKTRLKKEMIELQKLGERLVELPNAYLKKIGLAHELLEAVLYAKEVRTHGARRRQKQHIGVLMRKVDPSPIRKALDAFGQPRETHVPPDSGLDESIRELINGGDEPIEDMIKRYPKADRTRLRRLVRNARAESLQSVHLRATRALRAYLAEIM